MYEKLKGLEEKLKSTVLANFSLILAINLSRGFFVSVKVRAKVIHGLGTNGKVLTGFRVGEWEETFR